LLGVRTAAAAICFFVLVALVGLGPASSGAAKGPKKPRVSRYAPAAATGALGIDLLRALKPANVVLSPDSVAAALAMTGTGAVGRTADEMARTLRLKGPASFATVGDLQRQIAAGHAAAGAGDPEPPILEIANGLFPQHDLPFNPAFMSGAADRFAAAPIPVDYKNDPVGALQTINGWVSDRTRGKIPRILDGLPDGMALALANAIYFDGDWEHQFEKDRTAPGTFRGTAGKGTVQLMHQTTSLAYDAGRGYKAVALPYRSSTLSMLVVLPVKQRLGALQRRLGGKGLARLARGLKMTEVNLSLPRFHLNTAAELKEILARLGMPTAFSDLADFSGMTTAAALKIGFVKHAADIVVDEVGTVAAGATVVGMVKVKKPAPPVVFRADRPFLFFIRDEGTGAVLFAGRVTQPPPDAP
jgi:serpin B